jgi:hypothetical protein
MLQVFRVDAFEQRLVPNLWQVRPQNFRSTIQQLLSRWVTDACMSGLGVEQLACGCLQVASFEKKTAVLVMLTPKIDVKASGFACNVAVTCRDQKYCLRYGRVLEAMSNAVLFVHWSACRTASTFL